MPVIKILKRIKATLVRARLRAQNIESIDIPYFKGLWPLLNNKGILKIGQNAFFLSSRSRHALTVGPQATLLIGDNAFINDGVNICAMHSIQIGHHVKIGDRSFIFDTDFHDISPERPTQTKPVTIGNNVWIGVNCIILKGAHIGDHSIIAAGSVVTGTIPPKCIAAGNPAKVIRQLEISDENWVRR